MKNITKTMNENIANFLDGLYSETRVQLPAWIFSMVATIANCGH